MKSLFFVLPALLLGLTACGAPVAAVTLPDTVQVEKTQTAETAVLYEDADGREVSPRRAALTEWRWSVADDTIAERRLDHPDAAKRRRENFRQLPGAGVQPAARHCFGRLHAVF